MQIYDYLFFFLYFSDNMTTFNFCLKSKDSTTVVNGECELCFNRACLIVGIQKRWRHFRNKPQNCDVNADFLQRNCKCICIWLWKNVYKGTHIMYSQRL